MKIADKTTRLDNYIIDKIGLIIIIILHAFILDSWLHIIPAEGSPFLGLYFLFLYLAYHFLFEYFFSRTPGKFFTKTKVTDLAGGKPKTKTLLIRNLCRLIPFDNISFLIGKTGWHDSISETEVVVVNKPLQHNN